jgi:hypothetical protein
VPCTDNVDYRKAGGPNTFNPRTLARSIRVALKATF